MLILSRRPGDAIVIDGGIRIVVLASDKRGVRIGIEAPPHVSIVREEIVTQIVDENRRANIPPAAAALVGALAPAVAARTNGAHKTTVAPNKSATDAPAANAASDSSSVRNGVRIVALTATAGESEA